jgi:hypothetical protein
MVTARAVGRKPARGSLDRLEVAFDDEHAVAGAGLLLTATLAERLGIEALADQMITLGARPGAARPGRRVMTLVHSMVAGGDAIDDADVLRTGATAQLLGHRVMALSTLGTFLRSFTFGHVRQLDRLTEAVLARAWATGAGPGEGPMTIDLDSTICEVHGPAKGGASYGYTRVLGYHPLLATRAETGEVLHGRLRSGRAHSARGAVRFCQELAGRVRRTGAEGPLSVRADSGLWSAKIIAALRHHRIRFSITVRQTGPIRRTIAAIAEDAWVPIDYPAPGIAEVAQTRHEGERLIVRRVRHEADQGELVFDWRHHAFVTDRDGDARELDRDHRAHAVVELAIRDLKEGAGLAHCPSGRFFANAAWLVLSGLAHNLLRWVAALGLKIPGAIVAKAVRRRYLTLPGRITRSARRRRLHLPRDWPWTEGFLGALARLRAVVLRP